MPALISPSSVRAGRGAAWRGGVGPSLSAPQKPPQQPPQPLGSPGSPSKPSNSAAPFEVGHVGRMCKERVATDLHP